MRLRRDGGQPGDGRLAGLEERLAAVEDPVMFHPIGELGLLTGVREVAGGRDQGSVRQLRVLLAAPPEYPPEGLAELRARLEGAAGAEPGSLDLALQPMAEDEQAALGARLHDYDTAGVEAPAEHGGHGGEVRSNPFAARRATTRVLAVCSGKGGVGKSSVTVNLAVALARRGARVGLLDADIYGFSVPRMLGVGHPPLTLGRTLVPPVAHGVRVVSMGFFVGEEQAVAWRGPMLHKALEQFLVDVHWGRLDFLLVDMPPGTGDVPLSVAQQLPGAECYVVTTPQPAAQRVAQRAAALARQVRMPVRGVIENMSYWVAPDGTRHELFGSGGGAALAESLEVPLLAQLPLETEVRQGADEGAPAVVAAPGGEVARIFAELAERVGSLGPARVYRNELRIG